MTDLPMSGPDEAGPAVEVTGVMVPAGNAEVVRRLEHWAALAKHDRPFPASRNAIMEMRAALLADRLPLPSPPDEPPENHAGQLIQGAPDARNKDGDATGEGESENCFWRAGHAIAEARAGRIPSAGPAVLQDATGTGRASPRNSGAGEGVAGAPEKSRSLGPPDEPPSDAEFDAVVQWSLDHKRPRRRKDDEPSRERFLCALDAVSEYRYKDRDDNRFYGAKVALLALYDEAASRSPAPPVTVTDEDVERANQIATYCYPWSEFIRRVLEDYASRQERK